MQGKKLMSYPSPLLTTRGGAHLLLVSSGWNSRQASTCTLSSVHGTSSRPAHAGFAAGLMGLTSHALIRAESMASPSPLNLPENCKAIEAQRMSGEA